MVCQQLRNGMITESRKVLQDEKIKTPEDCKLQGHKVIENAKLDTVLILKECEKPL